MNSHKQFRKLDDFDRALGDKPLPPASGFLTARQIRDQVASIYLALRVEHDRKRIGPAQWLKDRRKGRLDAMAELLSWIDQRIELKPEGNKR